MPSLPILALFVAAGILPSVLWLLFYMRKDPHREPGSLLIKTFLMGVIVAPLAVILSSLFSYLGFEYFVYASSAFFLWAAFVEECIKFIAVRQIVLASPEFDEPVDAMIYMIAAGLGFAAIENILYLFQVIPEGAGFALSVLALRSVGSTLLHALASALVGYFIALSWFYHSFQNWLLLLGIFLATIFHFTFNIILVSSSGLYGLAYTTALLLAVAFLISVLFDKIKKRYIVL